MDESDDCNDLDDLLALLSDDEQDKQEEKGTAHQATTRAQNQYFADSEQNLASKTSEISIDSDSIELTACKGCTIRIDSETRAISRESLNLRLRHFNIISIKNLSNLLNANKKNSNLKNKNLNFVIIGVLCNKFIKYSQKGNKFMIVNLSDLNSFEITIFIFENDIVNILNKFIIGSVLAIANPKIMEPKNNNKNSKFNNKFINNTNNNNNNNNKIDNIALNIKNKNEILYIGKSLDIGFCKKIKQNSGGIKCNKIINKQFGLYCNFHSKQEYIRLLSKRNGLNRSQMKKFNNISKNRIQSITNKNSKFDVNINNNRFKMAKNRNKSENKIDNTNDTVCVINEKDKILNNYQKWKSIDFKRAQYYKAKNFDQLSNNNNNDNNKNNDNY